jgi:pyruvate dehydrogenase E2 component (dihydrolipoamide acetyltransferase)
MATRVIMPKLTDTMTEGVVIKWHKHEGDRIESGDALAEIETDKAVMDLEAFGAGTLRKILVPDQSTVPAGQLIAVIAAPDEDIASLLAETDGSATNPAAFGNTGAKADRSCVPTTEPPCHPATTGGPQSLPTRPPDGGRGRSRPGDDHAHRTRRTDH